MLCAVSDLKIRLVSVDRVLFEKLTPVSKLSFSKPYGDTLIPSFKKVAYALVSSNRVVSDTPSAIAGLVEISPLSIAKRISSVYSLSKID